MSIRSKRLERKLVKATDKRDDLRQYISDWGFARTPSEMRKLHVALDRAEAKVLTIRSEATR